ncbi:hypothetical protein CCACVL1_05515, partial [Corchorus capsularis]
ATTKKAHGVWINIPARRQTW